MDYVAMGRTIRDLRRRHGWSMAQLAQMAGVSLSYMGRIERGTRKLSLETAASLAQALNVTLDSLIVRKKQA